MPTDDQEVLVWRVTEKPGRVIVAQILSVLCFVLFGVIFAGLAVGLGNLPSEFKFGLREIGLLLAGTLLTLVLHELTHGLAMRLCGAKPTYGVLWKRLMLYATSPGYAYRRNDYLVILLAPLVLISALVVLGMWWLQGTIWVALLGICGAINASGAVGDLWITTIVLRYPAVAHVIDERDGVRLFLPKP